VTNQLDDMDEIDSYASLQMPDGTIYVQVCSDTLEALYNMDLGLVIVQGETTISLTISIISELRTLVGIDEHIVFRIYIIITPEYLGDYGNFANVKIFMTANDIEIPYIINDILVETSVGFDDIDLDILSIYRIIALDGEIVIGGYFDIVRHLFTFTTGLGSYTISYVPTLRRIQMQFGQYFIRDITQNRVDYMDTQPVIIQNRTLVPIRFVAEMLDAEVYWYRESRSVRITRGNQNLVFAIGEMAPGMDVPARIINNRTFVPLRFIAEFFGAYVSFDDDTRMINIIIIG